MIILILINMIHTYHIYIYRHGVDGLRHLLHAGLRREAAEGVYIYIYIHTYV